MYHFILHDFNNRPCLKQLPYAYSALKLIYSKHINPPATIVCFSSETWGLISILVHQVLNCI